MYLHTKKTCMQIFIGALFLVAKTGNNLVLAGKWIVGNSTWQ